MAAAGGSSEFVIDCHVLSLEVLAAAGEFGAGLGLSRRSRMARSVPHFALPYSTIRGGGWLPVCLRAARRSAAPRRRTEKLRQLAQFLPVCLRFRFANRSTIMARLLDRRRDRRGGGGATADGQRPNKRTTETCHVAEIADSRRIPRAGVDATAYPSRLDRKYGSYRHLERVAMPCGTT